MSAFSFKPLRQQATRYLVVGLFVVAVDYLAYVLMTHFFPSTYIAANILGKTVGAFSGFFLHKHYTFAGQQDKSTPTQMVLYVALYFGNMTLSSFLIYLGVTLFSCNELLAKIVADAAVIACSFLLNRLLVFKHSHPATGNET